jgi:uncharacterized protein (TIGR02145 family)
MKKTHKTLLFLFYGFTVFLFSSCCNEKITIISSFSTSDCKIGQDFLIEIKTESLSRIDSIGLCIGLKNLPTIHDSVIDLKAKKDIVLCHIKTVPVGKTYYLRAFAKNEDCTYYSNELIFAVDVDGNRYPSIQISEQLWFWNNLRTSRFKNGDSINFVMNGKWSNQQSPAYTKSLDTSLSNGQLGYYYNWYAVNDSKGICPEGWKVPSDSDWEKLEVYLQNNGYNYDGSIDSQTERHNNNKLAIALSGKKYWVSSTVIGSPGNTDSSEFSNKSTFSAIPIGYRAVDTNIFDLIQQAAYFWTSTEHNDSTGNAFFRLIRHDSPAVKRSFLTHNYGFSIRCVKEKEFDSSN